jgi:hypothetical protein
LLAAGNSGGQGLRFVPRCFPLRRHFLFFFFLLSLSFFWWYSTRSSIAQTTVCAIRSAHFLMARFSFLVAERFLFFFGMIELFSVEEAGI